MTSPTLLGFGKDAFTTSISAKKTRPRIVAGRRSTKSHRPSCEILEFRTLLSTMDWINPNSGSWDTASNWVNAANSSDHHVPTASDDAVISASGVTITHSANTADSVHSLTSESAVSIAGGSLTIASASTIDSSLNVGNGATLSLRGMALSGSGSLTNAGTLALSGSTINTSLTNQGTLTILPGATSFAGPFANAAGATLRLQADYNVGPASLTVAQGFTNAGLIDLTSTSNPSPDTLTVSAGTLVNVGTISSSVGYGGGRTLAAQFDNQAAGIITINQPLAIAMASAQDSNEGSIAVNAGSTLTQTGASPSFTSTGSIAIAAKQALAITGGTFDPDGGTLSGSLALSSVTLGSWTLPNTATVTMTNGGTAAGSGLTNQGTLTILPGSSSFAGPFANAAGATLRLQADYNVGPSSLTVAQGFTNAGLIDLTSTSNPSPDTLTVSAGTLVNVGTISSSVGYGGGRTLAARFDNQAAGTITINQPLAIAFASAQDSNEGSIAVNAGSTLTQTGTGASFTSTGSIAIAAKQALAITGGTFDPDGGTLSGALALSGVTLGSWTLPNTATVTMTNGGTAAGSGLTNQGSLTILPGTVAFAGPFANAAGATLRLQADYNVGPASLTIAQGFTNAGLIDLTSTSNPSADTLTVSAGTLVNVGTISSSVGYGGGRTLAARFDNQAAGTITINQPLAITMASAQDSNEGSIAVNAGITLTQTGTSPSFTSTGSIAIATKQTLAITGGTFDPDGGALSGALALTGVTLGSWTLPSTAIVTMTNGGTAAGSGLTNQGSLTILPGAVAFNGPFANTPGATLRLQADYNVGPASLTVAQGFTNAGLIDLTSTSNPSPDTLTVSVGTLVNDGTISSSVGYGGGRTLAARFDNQAAGTITINQPLAIAMASAQDSNEGTIAVNAGTTLTQTGTGPSFTSTGSITIAAKQTLAITGGTFDPDGGTLSGALALSGVTLGSWTLPSTAIVTMTNGGTAAGSGLTNQGSLTILPGSGSFAGPFANAAGATLRLQADYNVGPASLTVAQGFTNAGLIDLTSTSNPSPDTLTVSVGTLVNDGTISSSVGYGGGRTLAARFDNQAAGTITINQPLAIAMASAQDSNEGSIAVNAGSTLTQTGTGPSFTSTGSIAIAAKQALAITGGAFDPDGGTLSGSLALTGVTLGSWALPNTATVTMTNGGTAAGSSLTNQGSLTILPGSGSFAGPFANAAGATLRLQADYNVGPSSLTVAQGFTNAGLIDLTSTSNPSADTLTVSAGTLVNVGTITSSVGYGGGRTLAARFDNQAAGTITINQPLAIAMASAQDSNEGSIAVNAGSTLTQTGTGPSFTSTGSIAIAAKQAMAISGGTFDPDGGTLSGALALTGVTLGSWTLPSTAIVTMTNGGTAAGSNLTNQGTLTILPGATSFAGTFSDATGATLRLQADYNAGPASLTIAQGFTNAGLIDLTSTSNPSADTLTVSAGTLVNDGMISSSVGTGGGRTLAAQFDNQAAGTITVNEPLTLARASDQDSNEGAMAVNAALTLTQTGAAPSFTSTGAIAIATKQTLTITGGTFDPDGGTLSGALALSGVTLGSWALPNTATVTMTNGGTAAGSGLINQGSLTILPGAVAFNGPFANTVGATLRLQGDYNAGSANLTLAQGLTNAGLIDMTATGTNGTTDTLTVSAGTLINTGSITSAPGKAVARTSMSLAGGSFSLSNATITYVFASDSFSVTGAATLDFPSGPNLSVTLGTPASPGLVFSNGALTSLNATANFSMNLAGGSFTASNVNVAYVSASDTFNVSGAATLDFPNGPNLGLTLGSPASPGLFFGGGALTSLNATATLNATIAGVTLSATALKVAYALPSGTAPTNSR